MALGLAGATGRAEGASGPVRAGSFMVGGSVAYATLQLQELNTLIDNINRSSGTRYDDLNEAYEFTGEVRYAVSRRVSLGLEGGYLKGSSEDPVNGGTIEVTGMPFAATVAWRVHDEPGLSIRILGGLGVMAHATFREVSVGEVSASDIMANIGGELEWRPVQALGLSAQIVARRANVDRPEGFLTDLDFSGGSFRLGLRGYFGGHAQ